MKKRIAWIALFFIIVIAGIPQLIIPDAVYLRTIEIDINSGLRRERLYIASFVVRESIQDTPFSTLRKSLIASRVKQDWKMDASFSFGSHISPHYQYHGVAGNLQRLTLCMTDSGISEEEQRGIVFECIAALQNGMGIEFERILSKAEAACIKKLDQN